MSSTSPNKAALVPPSKRPSHNACLSCRSGKVKCRYPSIREPCERCRQNSLHCVFEQHRRGRKPGTVIRVKRYRPQNESSSSRNAGIRESRSQSNASQSRAQGLSSVTVEPGGEDELDASSPSSNWGTAGLQPVSILSKEAQSGKFSLENILCVPNVLEPRHRAEPVANGIGARSLDDPITCHILTFPVALGLFESFMRCLNPYISQLDPKLHTFDYVRQKSSFLLTTILSTSSKAFHPSLHPSLRSHSEKLLGEAFVRGMKSTETVQGILIFTYWKEPDEIRTWLLVGYAIRMCIELGWHELEPTKEGTAADRDETLVRERRNIERTWLVIFVYDRSLSLQLDKPYMINQNDFIVDADAWYHDEYAVTGGDLVLSAFVCLRILSTEILQLASPSKTVFGGPRGEILSKILNNSLTTWEQTWLPKFENEEISPSHRFLVNFYGLHLRLLLNSYSLQASLANARGFSAISKPALWLCSTSAIGMLEQISDEFGPFKQLYFVQDSIHVMVAYAAIFLIKLLVLLPKNMRSDIESHSLEAILKTAETFEQQCATQMTGCAMQARFLRSVIEKYQSLSSPEIGGNTIRSQASNNGSNQRPDDMHDHPSIPSNTQTRNYQQNQTLGADIGTQAEPAFHTEDVLGTNLFVDKDLWDNLFSDVGFWMNEGIPLSENLGVF